MSDTAFMIVVHVIAATPPTLMALAALITALKTKRDTAVIRVALNGRMDDLVAKVNSLDQKWS